MEREGVGCSTCQGIVFDFVKNIVDAGIDAGVAEPVESPDSSTTLTEEGPVEAPESSTTPTEGEGLVEAPDSSTTPTEEEDPPEYAAAPVELLWENGKVLQVWFLNKKKKHNAYIELIKEGVKEWEKYANVSFTFPEVWDSDCPPEVRIRFWDKPPGFTPEEPHHNISDGYWSYVGTACEQIAEGDPEPNFWNPTMSLRVPDLSRYEADFKATILHEFGHTLGFMHEHQRPDAKLLINYNMEEVYKHYRGIGWNKQRVDEQLFNFHEYQDKSAIVATEFDTTSIMMYDLPAKILTDKTKAVPKNMCLSQLDKDFVARLYPKGVEGRPGIQPSDIIPDPVEITVEG